MCESRERGERERERNGVRGVRCAKNSSKLFSCVGLFRYEWV